MLASTVVPGGGVTFGGLDTTPYPTATCPPPNPPRICGDFWRFGRKTLRHSNLPTARPSTNCRSLWRFGHKTCAASTCSSPKADDHRWGAAVLAVGPPKHEL